MELLSEENPDGALNQRLIIVLGSMIYVPDSAVGSGVTSFTDCGCRCAPNTSAAGTQRYASRNFQASLPYSYEKMFGAYLYPPKWRELTCGLIAVGISTE